MEAFESVDLVPKISGYLKSLKVDIGDAVKRGQVLAEIDAPELAAMLDRSTGAWSNRPRRGLSHAKAAVTVVEATLEAEKTKAETASAAQQRAESMLRYREKSLERYKGLAANNSISRELLDQAEERAEAAKAALSEAKAQAATVRAGIEEGKAKLLAAKARRPGGRGRRPRRQGRPAQGDNPARIDQDLRPVRRGRDAARIPQRGFHPLGR